ncbi:Rid family hydrolase [Agromyces sp. NPDC049794]|uniref:Rid family hydrolase n=1 Tax=unclassified Agromyces TaxID=2639701 RepID=UPI0033F6F111
MNAPSAPAAIGPYSHAATGDGTLFLSGQTPIDPATGLLIEGDVGAQTRRVFDNLTVAVAGLRLDARVEIECVAAVPK